MIKNYFKTAWRSLKLNKIYAAINIGGIAIGLTAFWLITLYVGDEMSYDTSFANADRICRIVQHASWPGGNMNIAIIGTGLIGQAWAIVFARGGCQVRLWDGDAAALERASGLIARQIAQLQDERLLDDAQAVSARIQSCGELAQALQGADYVQENLPEVLDIKQDIFRKLDALAAPQKVTISGKVTQYGRGSMHSSPRFNIVAAALKIACFPPHDAAISS